jgi:hypothetical protein
LEAALSSAKADWARAKASLLTLYQAMVLSPDLVPAQADELFSKYKEVIIQRHKRAEELGLLSAPARVGVEDPRIDDIKAKFSAATAVLDL